MKKTIILLTILTIIIISGCKKENTINYECIDPPELNSDMKLDTGQIPKGTWDEKECPSSKKVVYIDLIKTEDNSEWRKALYCEDENYFWIADFKNTRLSEKTKWYGVWDERPCALDE